MASLYVVQSEKSGMTHWRHWEGVMTLCGKKLTKMMPVAASLGAGSKVKCKPCTKAALAELTDSLRQARR